MEDQSDQTVSISNDTDFDNVLQTLLYTIHTRTIVLSVIMIIALAGNLFLAILIKKMSQRNLGPVHILILHTCLADICFALCTALPEMANTLTFPYFYGGDLLCRLVKYLQIVPMYASPYLLVAISIDRYVAICKPLLALKWKYGLVHALAGVAWTASLFFSIPNIFNFKAVPVDSSNNMACMSQLEPELLRAWITVFVLLVWLVPSVLVAIMYTLVCTTVWKSMRCTNGQWSGRSATGDDTMRRHSSAPSCARTSTDTTPTTMRKTYAPSVNAYKVKTVKLTMTIVIANFLLWAPFCIVNVVESYFPELDIDSLVATCIHLVGNANSCVNPWIYLIFNRKRVCDVFCGQNTQPNRPSSKYRNLITLVISRATPPRKLTDETNNANSRSPSPYSEQKNEDAGNGVTLFDNTTANRRYSRVSYGSLNSAF